MAPEELGEVVTETQLEFYPTGGRILTEDGGPVTFLRVIHSGAVDIVHEEKLLDLLGPGDTFGHAAMLSGLPPGFEARAAEDTLCYRIPDAVARPLLERARSRELRSGIDAPSHQAVAKLIRSPTVLCRPSETVREVAERMTERGATSAIVELDGTVAGIITDRDLRTRVLAAGAPLTMPAAEVMTAPVVSVTPDRLGGEVLFEMLERGIRHCPVISERGQLVGVVEDADLFAAQPRSWFGVRRSIARAADPGALAAVARSLPQLVAELHDSSLRASEIMRVLSALVDALTIRAIDLAGPRDALPADGVVWVALGSQARRELTAGSSPRGALVASEHVPRAWLESVQNNLGRCGIDVVATARTAQEWLAAAGGDEVALELLVERRPLWGTPRDPLPVPEGRRREEIVEALAARALASRPPTGFDAGAVLDADGKRHQRLDITDAAVIPIVALGRWAGAAAGLSDGSTIDRLRAGAADGVLSAADALSLTDAFELALELRVAHHTQQLGAGVEPSDELDPAAMSPLARDQLRDVFRTVGAVQRRLGG